MGMLRHADQNGMTTAVDLVRRKDTSTCIKSVGSTREFNPLFRVILTNPSVLSSISLCPHVMSK